MIQAMQPLNGLAIGDFVFAAVLVNVMPNTFHIISQKALMLSIDILSML